jgi:hypothetical protein
MIVNTIHPKLATHRDQQSGITPYEGRLDQLDRLIPAGFIVTHRGWEMTQAVSGCGGGSSRDWIRPDKAHVAEAIQDHYHVPDCSW